MVAVLCALAFLGPTQARRLAPAPPRCHIEESHARALTLQWLKTFRYAGRTDSIKLATTLNDGEPCWYAQRGSDRTPDFLMIIHGSTGRVAHYVDSGRTKAKFAPVQPRSYALAWRNRVGRQVATGLSDFVKRGDQFTASFSGPKPPYKLIGMNGFQLVFEGSTGRVLRFEQAYVSIPPSARPRITARQAAKLAYPDNDISRYAPTPSLRLAPLCRIPFGKYPKSRIVRLVWLFEGARMSMYVDAVNGEVLNYTDFKYHGSTRLTSEPRVSR